MVVRRLSLILPLALLPALLACHPQPAEQPLSPAALSAVVDHPGPPREALARAIDDLFSDPASGETRAVLILRDGRIVAERYAPGYGPDTRLIGWSMSKSVTAALIGLLVSDGRLRLDEPAPIPAWQRPGDPRGEITLRELMQMRSGLHHRENADPPYNSDTARMLFLDGRDDTAAYAEGQPLEDEPGTKWRYSTATSAILSDIATRALTDSADPAARQKAMADYLRTRLLEPAGLSSMVAEYDAAGTLLGSSMIHATARDWARFGELLRNQGSVEGRQILPREWVAFMTSPSPANPGYGAQIWLNRPQIDGTKEMFADRGPPGLFACVGHLGQYVLVWPEARLTVVRLGKTIDPKRPALLAHLADIVNLFNGE
jgi:CubicO group peptidase (beta-lactamase class C family)